MMIREGKYGSYTIFWKDKMVSSIPKHSKGAWNDYMNEGNDCLIAHLRDGYTLTKIINMCYIEIEVFYRRRIIYKKKASSEDHKLFCCFIIILVRLNRIDFDDVILEMCKKKPRKCLKSI